MTFWYEGSLAAARLRDQYGFEARLADSETRSRSRPLELHLHEGGVGGGILGLVSANGLEVSRVGNDDGAGAVGRSQNAWGKARESSGERK